LEDAKLSVQLAPGWPRGHTRLGYCLRQLGRLGEASNAFREGMALEPENEDWKREVEKTEQQRCTTAPILARQLVFSHLPELLQAWTRGRDANGVLQVRIRSTSSFEELGAAKWRLRQQGLALPNVEMRYAFLSRKDYLANLVAYLQEPGSEVSTMDVDGQPHKITDIMRFLPQDQSAEAAIHIDLQGGGQSFAIVGRLPSGKMMQAYLGTLKEPEKPKKREAKRMLDLQRSTGFPKALPKFLGFQEGSGALAFPVVDLERDAPGQVSRKP